jgi:hypothetical protein
VNCKYESKFESHNSLFWLPVGLNKNIFATPVHKLSLIQ